MKSAYLQTEELVAWSMQVLLQKTALMDRRILVRICLPDREPWKTGYEDLVADSYSSFGIGQPEAGYKFVSIQ